MTASAKRDRPSYSAGERVRNRVRAFADPRTGIIQIEWREKGRRRTRSLRHRDWARAKRQADELAASYRPDLCPTFEPARKRTDHDAVGQGRCR